MVNEFRFSWSQATSDAVQQSFGLTAPTGTTIPGSVTNPIVAGGLPGITIDTYFGGSGLGRIGSPDFLPKFQHTNQFEFIDTLSWLRGNHAVKAGIDLMGPMNNEFMDVPATRGSLRFRNIFTGNAMADFLLGYVSDLQLSNVFVTNQRHSAQMFFVQDDWKVNSRLSLNLGLRYDYMTPALEANNAMTNFNPAGTGSLIFATDGSLLQRSLVNPDRNNFAPRAGVVYKLDDNTILRGGYGVFYNLFDRVGSEDQLSLNLPGLVNKTTPTASAATGPIFFMQQGFPAGFLNAPNLDPAAGQLKAVRLRSVDQNDPSTTTQQASFGVQRELPGSMVLSADFVYTRTSNLATLINLNQPLPNAAGNNALGPLPYPNFGFIEWRSDNGRAEYKGLDLGLEKRFCARLRLRLRLHHRQIAGQRLGAADDAGLERVSAELARLRAVVRTERLRRSPPLQRQLRLGAAARQQRDRSRLDAVGYLHRAHRPPVHRHPGQQQRRHQHDRPAERERRHRGSEDG